jgi:hypothetical protein
VEGVNRQLRVRGQWGSWALGQWGPLGSNGQWGSCGGSQ